MKGKIDKYIEDQKIISKIREPLYQIAEQGDVLEQIRCFCADEASVCDIATKEMLNNLNSVILEIKGTVHELDEIAHQIDQKIKI